VTRPKPIAFFLAMKKDTEILKYPIGKFQKPAFVDRIQIENWINTIEAFPNRLKDEVTHLGDSELEKRYRPGGWTIRQVVNHCADSHMNSFIRFKLALTEEIPTIKPYLENLWAELPDSKNYNIESSLKILEGVHERWVYLLKSLTDKELSREFLHPETGELILIKTSLGAYAWHGEHHLAHIVKAKRSWKEY
jgi:uncharacterized damage-inducible protein DinB